MNFSLESSRDKGIIALLILSLLFGLLPLFIRFLEHAVSTYQQIYLRLGVGCILTFVLFYKSLHFKRIFSLSFYEHFFIFLRSFIYFFLGAGFYVQAILLTKINNVEFISSLPIGALFGFILLHEKITYQKVGLTLVSFIGVYIISVKDNVSLGSIGYGELLAFFSAVLVGLGMIMRKWQSKKLTDQQSSLIMLFYGSLFFFLYSLIQQEKFPWQNISIDVILLITVGGLILTGIGYLVNYGYARVDAVLASNIVALTPVFASCIAFFVFGELATRQEFIGSICIITSTLLLNFVEKKSGTK